MTTAALQDGLYKVEISGFGHTSSGVAVLRGTRLLGGDSSHYFCGEVSEDGGRIRADILASRHSQHASPAFGPLASARLLLVGQAAASSPRLTLIGAAEEIRAVTVMVVLSPLVLERDEAHASLTGVC